MDSSARLGLAYLAPGQLQKHVTLNEILTRLDALIQTRVVSRTTAVQPNAPHNGDLHILPAAATGADWASFDEGDLVRFEAGGWAVVEAVEGGLAWVADEELLAVRRASGWTTLILGNEDAGGATELQSLSRLGLNTTADATNPFAARINKALWAALAVADGGDGDLRMTFNKEAASDVGSLLFQSGWSGRAELGLIGDEDLTLKVSADGSTWRSAMTVDRTTGAVSFPAGGGRVETTVITVSGSWTVPTWARRIEAVAVGGSGGGGSGAAGATGVQRFGGGGGGAGGVSLGQWTRADIAASLSVTIGAGGAGGASVAPGAGADGGAGVATTVASAGVTLLTGLAGAGGRGGNATSGLGGLGGAGTPQSNAGGDSKTDASGLTGGALQRPDAGGGGGAGGGLDAGNTARGGGAGGQGASILRAAAGGAGGTGVAGGPGVTAASPTLSWAGGGGGGGGARTAAGYAGGGGAVGGGGGGGGAGVTTSGAGGVGGGGLVRLTAIG